MGGRGWEVEVGGGWVGGVSGWRRMNWGWVGGGQGGMGLKTEGGGGGWCRSAMLSQGKCWQGESQSAHIQNKPTACSSEGGAVVHYQCTPPWSQTVLKSVDTAGRRNTRAEQHLRHICAVKSQEFQTGFPQTFENLIICLFCSFFFVFYLLVLRKCVVC